MELNKTCHYCGNVIESTHPLKKFCNRDHKERYRHAKQGYWNASKKLREQLLERDNHVCAICDTKIDVSIKYPHPYSPSVDHIIPRSQGGGHDNSNLRVTHLLCNIKRSDKPSELTKPVVNFYMLQGAERLFERIVGLLEENHLTAASELLEEKKNELMVEA